MAAKKKQARQQEPQAGLGFWTHDRLSFKGPSTRFVTIEVGEPGSFDGDFVGAFVRLRPAPGCLPSVLEAAEEMMRAQKPSSVKVLPIPRSEAVPQEDRLRKRQPKATARKVAVSLVDASARPSTVKLRAHALVDDCLSKEGL